MKRQSKKKKAPAKKKASVEQSSLTHLDAEGAARMVDVGNKAVTHRMAMAEAFVRMSPETLKLLADGELGKGDALAVARVAGISASKRTSEIIPLAHPIPLTHVAVQIYPQPESGGVYIETRAECVGVTGVELEALVAASAAALTIYDMGKAHDRGMVIDGVQLVMKSGGRSGTYRRAERRGETERAPRPTKKKTAKKKSKRKAKSSPKKKTKS